MKLLRYSLVIDIIMLVASTVSVSAETITTPSPAVNTPGFDIVIFIAAIVIAVLALILYRGYKKRKKAIGYEYPAHEKGKLK